MEQTTKIKQVKIDKYRRAETIIEYDSKFTEGFGKVRDIVEQAFVLRHSYGNILDGGIGTGRFALSPHLKGNLIMGVDTSKAMLEEVKKKDTDRRIILIQADLEHLPFKKNVFDTIISMRVFMHLPQYKDILRDCAILLKKDGAIIFNIPNGDHLNFCKKILSIFGLRRPGTSSPSSEDYTSFATKMQLIDIARSLNVKLIIQPYDFLEAYWFSKIRFMKVAIKKILLNRYMITITHFFERYVFRYLPSFASMRYLVIMKKT